MTGRSLRSGRMRSCSREDQQVWLTLLPHLFDLRVGKHQLVTCAARSDALSVSSRATSASRTRTRSRRTSISSSASARSDSSCSRRSRSLCSSALFSASCSSSAWIRASWSSYVSRRVLICSWILRTKSSCITRISRDRRFRPNSQITMVAVAVAAAAKLAERAKPISIGSTPYHLLT